MEQQWLQGSIRADDQLYEWANSLIPETPDIMVNSVEPMATAWPRFWWPRLRHPEDFWIAYTSGNLPPSTLATAKIDMQALDIPTGLSRENFERTVKASLLQKVERAWVDERIMENQRFGAMRDWLSNLFETHGIERSPAEAWQTMIRWLLYFLPDRYSYKRPRHSEILELKNTENR